MNKLHTYLTFWPFQAVLRGPGAHSQWYITRKWCCAKGWVGRAWAPFSELQGTASTTPVMLRTVVQLILNQCLIVWCWGPVWLALSDLSSLWTAKMVQNLFLVLALEPLSSCPLYPGELFITKSQYLHAKEEIYFEMVSFLAQGYQFLI